MFIVLILNSEIIVLNFKILTYFPILYCTIINEGVLFEVFVPNFYTLPRRKNSPRKFVLYNISFKLIFAY